MADALFDTTVFVDYLHGDSRARSLVDGVLDRDATGSYSPVTTFEIWLGLLDHEEEMAMRLILRAFEPAVLTNEAAMLAAGWLRGLSPRRAEAMFRDALIAATASERGEVVITRNVKDFQRLGVNVQAY